MQKIIKLFISVENKISGKNIGKQMLEIGQVVKIKKGRATVSFKRQSACDSCHMCAVTKDGMKVETLIPNSLDANVGDFVEVEMGGRFVLTAAVVAYIIPLLLVGAGIAIGTLFSEMIQFVLALVGLVIGIGIAIVIDKAVKKKKGFTPQMVRFASPDEIVKKPMEFPQNKH